MAQDGRTNEGRRALRTTWRRHWRGRIAAALAFGAAGAAFNANAVGSLVDVVLVDRDAASVLDVYPHRGTMSRAGPARVTRSGSRTAPANVCWR